jgi:hypothetical protein
METDYSKVLYETYFSSNNRLIEVTLKNGRKITGEFISFFFGEEDNNQTFIKRWQIVEEKYKVAFCIDAFGSPIGELINQKDIKSVKFLDNNSQIQF